MFSINPRINEEYFIVFEDSPKRRWFTRYLKPGFTHCYLMYKSVNGLMWVIINPMWSHCDVDVRTLETFPSAQDYAGEYAIVVKFNATINPDQTVAQLSFMSCVDFIKRFIGLARWRVITPYQLYKELSDG